MSTWSDSASTRSARTDLHQALDRLDQPHMDHHSRWDDWSESFAASVRTVNVVSADAGPAACLAEDYNILQRVVLGDSGNVANIDPVIVEIDSFRDGRHQVRRA